MTREQLLERKLGIGGSDIPIIMGCGKADGCYKTKFELFQDKYNMIVEEPENLEQLEWGEKIESLLIESFGKKHSEVFIGLPQVMQHSKENNIFIGNADGIYYDNNDVDGIINQIPTGIIEAKNTTKSLQGEPLLAWILQINWYMGIYECGEGYIIWLENGCRYNEFPVEFNPELYELQKIEAIKFWDEHILPGIAPIPETKEDYRKVYSTANIGTVLEANHFEYNIYEQLLHVKEKIKLYESEKEELELQIRSIMKDYEVLNYNGKVLFTLKNQTRKQFDTEIFKIREPELYEKYCKMNNIRTLLIK